MLLTDDIIKLTYYLASKFVGKRKDINPEDLAHYAFIILSGSHEIPDCYRSKACQFAILNAYQRYWTNKTMCKKHILLDKSTISLDQKHKDSGKKYEVPMYISHDCEIIDAKDKVESILNSISKDERDLLIERYFEHKKYLEMSKPRGVTKQAVRSRILRILERIRRTYGNK